MLLVGGNKRYRQVPGGRVEQHVCEHCRTTRTFVECTKTLTVDVWFIDVYKDTERVLCCVECREERELVSLSQTATPKPSPPKPSPRAMDDQLAKLKAKMAASIEIAPSRASAQTQRGTCVLFDRAAIDVALMDLAAGTTCAEQAERGNAFFAWVPKPPTSMDLVLRVGLEIPADLQRDAKSVTQRFLRVPSGTLVWAPLDTLDAATEIPVPSGNYFVDAWLAQVGARSFGGWFGTSKHTLAVRLRRTDARSGQGGGVP